MSKDPKYIVASEVALDALVSTRSIDESGLPAANGLPRVKSQWLDDGTLAFCTGSEHESEYFALVGVNQLRMLKGPLDLVYSRIARLLKAARTPPVHLPRSWAEFHLDNLVSFFAESDRHEAKRWVAEIDGTCKFIRFLKITDSRNQIDLNEYAKSDLASPRAALESFITELRQAQSEDEKSQERFVSEFDLSKVGEAAVTAGQTYEGWLPRLSNEQLRAVELAPSESVRIVGPAGSGKTLTLCMRALNISRTPTVVSGRKKILIVAHSWAMAERIDQIMLTLNSGTIPDSITVLPLFSVIQLHANSSVGTSFEVLGDDSREGSRLVMEILDHLLNEDDIAHGLDLSPWIRDAISDKMGGTRRSELIFDLYEEITSVIAAQNIFPGDNDKIASYFSMEREDYLPPFVSRQDRIFCIRAFESLISRLVDRGLVTTDQLILDSIRVFETFGWNVRRQTEGYDYILVDELQLFGPQERLAISLLARVRVGFAWAAAEDPSQGVFSSLYGREKNSAPLDSIYLNDVHRFNAGLFNFVQFVYGKFPFNVPALNISRKNSSVDLPVLESRVAIEDIPRMVRLRAKNLIENMVNEERLAIVVIGGSSDRIFEELSVNQMNPVLLHSFDDIEALSYQKRAIVVSPWQFIGGTQFSHVILVISEESSPNNAFARLRELTAIYLGASRASERLAIICGHRIPQILDDASCEGVLTIPSSPS
ncbi:UvrD-helicase domain-containing protein [Synechococcus sp. CBW1107]|uniref:UvrD-helicase domain-containing protein n=1 Tax=Synechococcus sp. CBW1107 TaxID=2789857 RepID=UPI002AD1E64B|nr:UvrD-helicase domain-containing protein [Synechococcus sp. CBW1107]CAK6697293.1 hypothetical protein ICNINCKA_02200 [Synechococcus sp. CBW1107]